MLFSELANRKTVYALDGQRFSVEQLSKMVNDGNGGLKEDGVAYRMENSKCFFYVESQAHMTTFKVRKSKAI